MNKRWIIASVVSCVLLLSVSFVLALEPPPPGEIERLRLSGELPARLEQASALGNHLIDPYLLEQALTNAKREALAQQGHSPAVIDQEAPLLLALPSRWQGMPTTGQVKIFALLIDFSDYPAYNSKDAINSALFGDGSLIPMNSAPYESLTSYYKRSSYNQLDLSSSVTLGWYRPAYTRASMLMDTRSRENLIKEAIAHFKAQGQDFSQFDNNGDGTIDYFAVIWTGPDNGWSNFWWGAKYDFPASAYTVDGKRLGSYSWQWEYNNGGIYSGPFSPLTVIHETGHALGLPDYYDWNATYGPAGGVGHLDMMDGNWGDHNSFSKWVLGWLTPKVVARGSRTITLNPSGTNGDAVLIMPGAISGDPFREFFIAQNRYRAGNDFNVGYPADGMLIWHVDARLNATGTNTLYDNQWTTPKLLKLMQADGFDHIENNNYVVQPEMYYQPGNELTPLSTPSSSDNSGVATGVAVRNIVQAGQQMRATFSIETILNENFESITPPTLPAGWVQSDSDPIVTQPKWETTSATSYPSEIVAHSGQNLVYFNSHEFLPDATRTLVTQAFSLTGVAFGKATFWMYRDNDFTMGDDFVNVYINTNATRGDATLLGTGHRYNPDVPSYPFNNPSFTGGWYKYEFAIPEGYTGGTNYLLFEGVSQYGYDIHLDDIVVTGVQTATAKIGVFDDGTWYLDSNQSWAWEGSPADTLGTFGVGITGAIPVVGDWTGDGNAKIGVFTDGIWYLDMNRNWQWDGETIDKRGVFGVGLTGAIPVVGDWTGDGISKIGVYMDGTWYLDMNNNWQWDGETIDKRGVFGVGLTGAMPVVGDWTGDGITKIGVYMDGTWYLDMNNNWQWDGETIDKQGVFGVGIPGAVPVIGDWTGDGIAKIGVYADGIWYLDMNNTWQWDGEPTDKIGVFGVGLTGVVPVTGKW
ncbi:MAG: M6 family metalloprotease domain-containing protein [Thermodesulfovibrionales bacterium]